MARKWWTLGVVSIATFMLLLDITVVNTALPAIQTDLDASFTDLQWVIDAYTLTLAAFVLTAGVLADRLGRRRVFAVGLAIFTVSSLVAGFASEPLTLNVARAVQGIGGAVMFAVSLALVAQEFAPGKERGMAMGIYGATIGAAVAIGPMVGGAIVDGIGWEWVFFLNVPIGVAALAVTLLRVRETRDPNATRIDWWGQILLSVALFGLVFAMLRGNDEGWGSTLIVSLLAGSAVLIAAFVAVERRVSEPMLPLGFFSIRSFTGIQVAAFAISGAMFAMFLYLTLYMQNYLGLSAFDAGLRYLPMTVISFFVAGATGAFMGRFQARAILGIGLALVGLALVWMGGIDAGDGWTTLLGGFVLAGIGVGMLNPVIADVAVSVVPKDQSGMAAGINDTFRQVGVAVGIAVWGALFVGHGSDKVSSLVAGTPAASGERPRQLVEAASSGNLDAITGQLPSSAVGQVTDAARAGFLSGLNEILLIAGILAFAGAVLSFLLVREDQIERGAEIEVAVDDSSAPGGSLEPEPAGA